LSDRQQRRERKEQRRQAVRIGRSSEELVRHLREQVGFIERSAEAFDNGRDEEAKRIAVNLRVLLHDTRNSVSLLGQLRQLGTMGFLDSADPISPGDMLTTLGLVMIEARFGEARMSGRYIPYLGRGHVAPRWKPFEPWWTEPVTRAGGGSIEVTRRDYVLSLADTEGGAHVDPTVERPIPGACSRERDALADLRC
jgi:hypothetical protein